MDRVRSLRTLRQHEVAVGLQPDRDRPFDRALDFEGWLDRAQTAVPALQTTLRLQEPLSVARSWYFSPILLCTDSIPYREVAFLPQPSVADIRSPIHAR